MEPENPLPQLQGLLGALGNEARVLMLEFLSQGPMTVGHLAQRVCVRPSVASEHLTVLRAVGWVVGVRQGSYVVVCMNPLAARKVLEWAERLKGALEDVGQNSG